LQNAEEVELRKSYRIKRSTIFSDYVVYLMSLILTSDLKMIQNCFHKPWVEIIPHYDIVAHFDLELHQMDVKTTFLNEDLKDEVYMTQPKGFINNSQNACKLKNSIYRLWQISYWWYTFYKVIASLLIENLVN
jgi:hypothetical protein